jgi:hypothetical protein
MVLASVILRVSPDKRPQVLAVIDDIVERNAGDADLQALAIGR